jgi:hypothetical protein
MSCYDEVNSIHGELKSIGISIPGMEKPRLCRSIHTGSGFDQASYSNVIGCYFLGAKEAGE